VTGVAELTAALVAAASPNPPGDEREVAAVAREALASAGLPAPRVIAREPARPSLLTTLDFGPGGRHLVLCGHLDTKPVGGAAWSVDPFAATIDGDRLYGLGATDMKGAVAAMIAAAERLDLSAGRLSLLLVADEENGAALGARHVAATVDLDADAIVIGEPCGREADFDRLPLVSRGIARWRVVARAAQGHSLDERDEYVASVLDHRFAAIAVGLYALAERRERFAFDGVRTQRLDDMDALRWMSAKALVLWSYLTPDQLPVLLAAAGAAGPADRPQPPRLLPARHARRRPRAAGVRRPAAAGPGGRGALARPPRERPRHAVGAVRAVGARAALP
jgi:acetylornithine deacetylase/succinyl-diaminopimelate desuccinylase-like protein